MAIMIRDMEGRLLEVLSNNQHGLDLGSVYVFKGSMHIIRAACVVNRSVNINVEKIDDSFSADLTKAQTN